jgi:hypothetical protein
MTPKIDPASRREAKSVRSRILRLPFPEWRQVVRLRLLHGMGINAVAKLIGMGYVRCQRMERLAMAALAALGEGEEASRHGEGEA